MYICATFGRFTVHIIHGLIFTALRCKASLRELCIAIYLKEAI